MAYEEIVNLKVFGNLIAVSVNGLMRLHHFVDPGGMMILTSAHGSEGAQSISWGNLTCDESGRPARGYRRERKRIYCCRRSRKNSRGCVMLTDTEFVRPVALTVELVCQVLRFVELSK